MKDYERVDFKCSCGNKMYIEFNTSMELWRITEAIYTEKCNKCGEVSYFKFKLCIKSRINNYGVGDPLLFYGDFINIGEKNNNKSKGNI